MSENFADFSPESPDDRVEAQEIQELKQALAANAQSASAEIEGLRTQIKWLTGLAIAGVVAFGGILAGVTFSLKNEQTRLAQQIETIDGQVSAQRLENLETQINAFNQQVLELNQQVGTLIEQEGSDNGLQDIKDQLQKLVTSIKENLANPKINRQLNRLNELLHLQQQEPESTELPADEN